MKNETGVRRHYLRAAGPRTFLDETEPRLIIRFDPRFSAVRIGPDTFPARKAEGAFFFTIPPALEMKFTPMEGGGILERA